MRTVGAYPDGQLYSLVVREHNFLRIEARLDGDNVDRIELAMNVLSEYRSFSGIT